MGTPHDLSANDRHRRRLRRFCGRHGWYNGGPNHDAIPGVIVDVTGVDTLAVSVALLGTDLATRRCVPVMHFGDCDPPDQMPCLAFVIVTDRDLRPDRDGFSYAEPPQSVRDFYTAAGVDLPEHPKPTVDDNGNIVMPADWAAPTTRRRRSKKTNDAATSGTDTPNDRID